MAEDKSLDNELENEPNSEAIQSEENSSLLDSELKTDISIENTEETISNDTNEAIEPSFDEDSTEDSSQELITVRPIKFQQFEVSEPNRSIKKNLDIMQDVSMHISVELGKTQSTIKEVMDYKEGSIVELDKIAGEQVEVYANNKLVAKGEVIVIEDKFGVRVTSTNLPKTIQ